MSVLKNLLGRIFGHAEAAPADFAQAAAPGAVPPSVAAPATPISSPAAPAMNGMDLAAVMEAKEAANPQKLNWRTSIVDLMKLLDMDSGLAARKELAQELGYGGDMNDSAAMNTWLHRQVMQKVAENGGQVPAGLKG